MRNKKAAVRNIGLDLNSEVIAHWRKNYPDICELHEVDAGSFLLNFGFTGNELVYVDPPYVPETRRRIRVYRHDYSLEDHQNLLKVLKALPCKVMLSGYDSELYRTELADWRKIRFFAKTHVDVRDECVWMNFAQQPRLHDSSFIGNTFRDRQNIQRRQSRLRTRIHRMDPIERSDLLHWIRETYGPIGGNT